MNKFERELKSYRDSTEKMSGFDSYDFEGDFNSFDGNDTGSYFGGNDTGSYASGGGAPAMISPPYMIQYANTTASDVTCYLFGFNNWGFVTNGNNPAAAVITNLMTGGSYQALLNQTGNKPFQITNWRMSASGSNVSLQLSQTATIYYVDNATGETSSLPFPWIVFKNSFQQQSDLIDGKYPVLFTANTYVTFTLKASTTIIFTMQPDKVISDKAALHGAPAMGRFKSRNLSPNGSPVVIQTTEGVKSIAKS